MTDIERLIRPNIKELTPYSSARQEYDGQGMIYMDANENSFGFTKETIGFNRYPDPNQRALKQRIAQLKGVEPERIFIGNGSDEAIDLLFRVFCRPGLDNVIIMPPTYGMYEVAARINDVSVTRVTLTRDFEINVPGILDAITENTKMIFVCSPNNPTGNCFARDRIARLLDGFSGLVVVDEAYIDFCEHPGWLEQIDTYDNLVVLQTFSKAWGMAGIRVGMAFGHPLVVSMMNRIKYPYNVNALSQAVALKALGQAETKERIVKQVIEQRELLRKELDAIPFIGKVFASDANFLLARVRHADAVYRYLIGNGIVVRNRSGLPFCEECLRFTVGTPQENQALIKALRSFSG